MIFNRILVISAILMTTACDRLQLGGTMLLVDLDAVAAATGQDDIMSQRVAVATQDLDNQLRTIGADLNRQLEAEKQKRGTMSAQEQQEMAQLTAQARARFAQTQQLARQRAAEFRSGLIAEFVVQIKPITAEIADQRGASAVFTQAPTLLWHDSGIDITDEVIAAVRARGISLEGVPQDAAEEPGAGD